MLTRLLPPLERVATFRWLGVLDIFVYVAAGCCCVIPPAIVASVMAGDFNLNLDMGDPVVDTITSRLARTRRCQR